MHWQAINGLKLVLQLINLGVPNDWFLFFDLQIIISNVNSSNLKSQW